MEKNHSGGQVSYENPSLCTALWSDILEKQGQQFLGGKCFANIRRQAAPHQPGSSRIFLFPAQGFGVCKAERSRAISL